MRTALLVILLAALLPAAAADEPKPAVIAGLYGETLGAASACPAIAPARVAAAADLVAGHLRAVFGAAAADEAAKPLEEGIARGKRAIAQGLLTCAQAESELGNLEHDLSH
jgi:hypothetical protein